jgi:hypothetical protein
MKDECRMMNGEQTERTERDLFRVFRVFRGKKQTTFFMVLDDLWDVEL